MTDAPSSLHDSHLFADIAAFAALRLRFSDPGLSEWHQRSIVIRPYCARSEFAPLLLFLASARVYAQSSTQDELEQLRKQVAAQQTQMAAQQNQIDELRRMLLQQSKLLASLSPSANPPDSVASIGTPVVPAAVPVPEQPKAASQPVESDRSPLAIGIGPIELTPTGFIEYSQVWRSKTVTSGLPTNFAGIPFDNTVEGHRRETLSTAANSRLGLQLNAAFSKVRLLGVIETDFLGFQPGNISTTTNSYGLRLRLAFADLEAGKWEFLGGQDWSLLTPARKGIPALTSGLMLTQDLDPNIQSGLVWGRVPQFRAVYRPNRGIAVGASVESGETYAGGSSGAGTITLPSALAPNYFNQVDLGTSGLAVPNPHLDFIGKVAFDWTGRGRPMHLEVAGMMNQFALYNPLSNQHFSTLGGAGSLNAGFEIGKGLSLMTANFYSDGGGRFIYGEAPALIIEGSGAPSLVHSMSTLQGLEYQATPKLKLWTYYGGTYINKNIAIDPSNGGLVGYGYSGSPNNQNRSIQEVTAGLTRVFHREPVGTFQASAQYSFVIRHPWYVAPSQPGNANLNMLYISLRYLLPAPSAR
jgi:hypothetical protein